MAWLRGDILADGCQQEPAVLIPSRVKERLEERKRPASQEKFAWDANM